MKKMIIIVLSVMMLCRINLFNCYAYESNKDELDFSDLEDFVDQLFEDEMNELNIPGASITIVYQDKILLSKGYGYSDLETSQPVESDKTVFRIGSVSKLFVADAAMLLVEEGKLDLHEDINTYLKTFQLDYKDKEPITMHHLLTHTSGLDDQRIGDLSKDIKEVEPLSLFLKDHLLPIIRRPGEVIQYNSYGMALAGAVIEEITGMSYMDYLEKRLFQPLNMDQTSMLSEVKALSKAYYYGEDGYKEAPSFGYFNIYPAGGALATTEDMGKYMMMHLNDGVYNKKTILSQESISQMHQRQEAFNEYLSGMGYSFWQREYQGVRLLEHGGYGLGYLSDLCLIPEYNLGIFISVNQGENNFPEEAIRKIITNYIGQRQCTIFTSSDKICLGDLKPYEGYYRFLEMTFTTFDKASVFPYGQDIEFKINQSGNLEMIERGPAYESPKTYELTQIDTDVFMKNDGKGIVAFRKNASGQYSYMAESGTSFHGTYSKLKWYEYPLFQMIIGLGSLGIFIMVIVGFIFSRLYCIMMKVMKKKKIEKYKLTTFIALLSFLHVGFLITSLFTFPGRLQWGVPLDVKLLLCVPIMAVILTIVIMIQFIFNRRQGKRYGIRGFYYAGMIFVSWAYIWFLNYWNLLGFRY